MFFDLWALGGRRANPQATKNNEKNEKTTYYFEKAIDFNLKMI